MMSLLESENLLSIWNSVKESVRQNTTRGKEPGGLDYSFITPTLLALGKLPENRVDELLLVLQGSPALIWNLSGKPFPALIKNKLKSQVLDASWITPGQFTQAPSLECIFGQCYSIKSWLDLKNDHVAIVHCANGRSRSGILIACLLKYIGAFEHASHAFDFFCSARMQIDSKPSLAPSYRILFENIDKAVDLGGYPNGQPMHFKCIAISGLPVDEIPCVEVWDMAGQLFASHVQWKHTNKCTWSADYGDGFFRIASDIQGDFSVMVRFGGHHALTRDKTTLIFKYQNSTAFLPPEVVELKRQNVDVNPEYSESLDVELFAVHLMFEPATGEPPRCEYRAYRTQGRDAFEAGLDEISKQHPVEPDSVKNTALVNMGFPELYTSLALQIANNSLDVAAEFIMCMKARAAELEVPGVPSTYASSKSALATAATAPKTIAAGGGTSDVKVESPESLRKSLSGSALCYASTSPYSAEVDKSKVTLENTPSVSAIPDNGTPVTPKGGGGGADDSSEVMQRCSTCQDDNILKRDQVISCISCSRAFHTSCVGVRRIPFTLKTARERQNRDKYISKHYGQWRCSTCSEGGIVASAPTTPTRPVTDQHRGGQGSGLMNGLFGSIEASSVTGIYPPPNSASDALSISLTSGMNLEGRGDSKGAQWSPSYSPTGSIGFSQGVTPVKTKHDQAAILMGLLAATGLTVEQLMHMGEEKQREALVAAAAMQNNKSRSNSGASDSPPSLAVSSIGVRAESPRLASKIFETSQTAENVISSSTSPQGHTAAAPPAPSAPSAPALRSNEAPPAPPAPASEVFEAKLRAQAAEPSKEEAPAADPKAALMAMIAKRNSDGVVSVENPIIAANPPPASAPTHAAASDASTLQNDPAFAKFFKMVKVGLPKGSVAAKMAMEGVAPSIERAMEILNMTPPTSGSASDSSAARDSEPTPSKESAPAPKVAAATGMVPVSEHPSYAKFFKMIKVGLPKENVKLKMKQEEKNPDWLDKDPSELVPLDESSSSDGGGGATVAVSEHPIYSKYFRMLKVGLPKDAIKAKMSQEGANPSFLDMEPSNLVPLAEAEGIKVAVGEHPKYAKFFKMLKVGLPPENIKLKMKEEGLDPSFIEKPFDEMVFLSDAPTSTASAAIGVPSKVAAADKAKLPRKKKLHWKALDASKVGSDSLWADKDDGMNITLDEAEFNQLFVESQAVVKVVKEEVKEGNKKKRVNLVDMKRAQNGGIALARIKISFSEVKEKIQRMEDDGFTTDQLRSLEEYLPTQDEIFLIKAFKGDREMLGQAEKYMLEMMNSPTAARRIQCMIFKQQFKGRITESKTVITKIENACDDVKMSVRLKKVLKTILKVGNQMNDGADHLGFTLDALLKLQSAKAFDKKTSVLQYVITLIQRNDENCLLFPEDLGNVAEASRLTLESVLSDHATLRQNLDKTCRVMTDLAEQDGTDAASGSMASFLAKARQICDDLDALIASVQKKYEGLLAYFGEEPNMQSSDFFSTLSRFILEFSQERELVERLQKKEKKEAAQQALAANVGAGGGPFRRASVAATGSTSQRVRCILSQPFLASSNPSSPRSLHKLAATLTQQSAADANGSSTPGLPTSRRSSMF